MRTVKNKHFASIQVRLSLWLFLFALLPLLLGIITIYYSQKQSLEQQAYDKLTLIRDQKVQQISLWLDERVGDLKTISQDPIFIALEKLPDQENREEKAIIYKRLEQTLRRYLKNYAAYKEFIIINPKTGLVEISTNQNSVGANKSQDPSFTSPMNTKTLFVRGIYYSQEHSEPDMSLSIPIFRDEHHPSDIIGIMVTRIDLNASLYPLIQNKSGHGESGETVVVNQDSVVLNELRWYEHAPFNLTITAPPATKAARGEQGLIRSVDYRQEKVLAAYTHIAQTNWGIVVKQNWHEITAPIRKLTKTLATLFILSAILILLVVLWLSKKLLTPVRKMNRTAEKIKNGDYSARNTITSDDELGLLAQSNNEMMDAIVSMNMVQEGVGHISETIIKQPSFQHFGSELLKELLTITTAQMGTFYILNEKNSIFEHFVSIGANEKLLQPFSSTHLEGEFGTIIATKSIHHLKNIPKETIFTFRTTAGDIVPKEIVTLPIVIDDVVVGLLSLISIQSFTYESIEIIKQVSFPINTAYAAMLGNERTAILAENLAQTNQHLEAQTEELQEQSEELQSQSEELQQITEELKDQNIALEAKNSEVEHANRLKTEFLANISHELRTPLNSILTLSRVLIMQTKDCRHSKEDKYLNIIEKNGMNLLSLINGVLDLSRIEVGKMIVTPQLLSIASLLSMARDNLQILATEKKLYMNLHQPKYNPQVKTDEKRLYQILMNIIGNAIKFTKKGGIDIYLEYDATQVIIKVKDSGIGIPKEILPDIFTEFIQGDSSLSRQYEGTGLGLTIAKKTITILGGDIHAKSVLGSGTTLTITLPILWYKDSLPADESSITRNEPLSIDQFSTPSLAHHLTKHHLDFTEKHILLIDDSKDSTIQVCAVLKYENFHIDSVESGKEALAFLKHNNPDGIILDLMMPGMDGFELLTLLRAKEHTKNIPILILTAKDLTQEDLQQLKDNDIQQVIQKGDVDINDLCLKARLLFAHPTPSSQKQNREKHTSSLPTLLVVEDNSDNMIAINAILRGHANIIEAYDGESAVEIVKTEVFDLVLLDISLPKMSGIEVIKILKGDLKTKDIPVIAVTAQAMSGDKERLLQIGFDGYIAKPIDIGQLLKEINLFT